MDDHKYAHAVMARLGSVAGVQGSRALLGVRADEASVGEVIRLAERMGVDRGLLFADTTFSLVDHI